MPIVFRCTVCSNKWQTKPEHIIAGHGCPHCCRSGKNSGTWQGGLTSEALTIRHSKRYCDWRDSVFIRDDFTCKICNKRGVHIAAHHKNSFSKYPNLRFDITNGVTLCKDHHNQYHKDNGYSNTSSQFEEWSKHQTAALVPLAI